MLQYVHVSPQLPTYPFPLSILPYPSNHRSFSKSVLIDSLSVIWDLESPRDLLGDSPSKTWYRESRSLYLTFWWFSAYQIISIIYFFQITVTYKILHALARVFESHKLSDRRPVVTWSMSTVGSVCLWILLLYTLYPILLTNIWKEMQFSLPLIDGLWFSRVCGASVEALVFFREEIYRGSPMWAAPGGKLGNLL